VMAPLEWVKKNSGPLFQHLWTKVYFVVMSKFLSYIVVCNAVFLLISHCVVKIFVIKSEIAKLK